MKIRTKKLAFTMAEILISLTIIGIIAAITLPALQGNINEKTWATQRKALYSRMTQAISMMPALNGHGVANDEATTAANATQEFIAELGKVLKINNVCDGDHLTDCGIKEEDGHIVKVNDLTGAQRELSVENLRTYLESNNLDVAGHISDHNYYIAKGGLETANGESMLVFYNPYCTGNAHIPNPAFPNTNAMYQKVCANFIFDLNGTKGPNTMGKDIGIITAFYATDSIVVSPLPLSSFADPGHYSDAMASCRTKDEDSRLPNLEEGIAMAYNAKLLKGGINASEIHWTNSISDDPDSAWVYGGSGSYHTEEKEVSRAATWCVKR